MYRVHCTHKLDNGALALEQQTRHSQTVSLDLSIFHRESLERFESFNLRRDILLKTVISIPF